jgi:amino acid transporter
VSDVQADIRTEEPQQLRRVLKVRHAVITSMAVITPTGAILFLPIPIAAFAGKAMPLSVLVAFAVTFVIMNAVYRFSQRISHAGSFFAFVSASLGTETGFFAGWLFMAFYPVLVGLDMILFGATLNGIILAHGGPNIPWWLLMIVGLALIWGIGVIGIRFSARSDFVLLTFEIGVLLALAITILVTGAPGGDWHAQVFNPSAAPGGFGGVAVGAVFGVLAFTGFEASAYLGEEAENPRRTIPRALLITVALVGVLYVFFFYVVTVGFGLSNVAKIPTNAAPWDSLGIHYWGSGPTVLVDIASVVALIAGGLAAQNGAARMAMALGREGLLPPLLGRTTRKFGTPGWALTFLLGVSIAMGLGFGEGFQPLPAFSLLSLIVTLCALGVYVLAQIGLVRYFWKRGSFNVLWHLILPLAATAAIGYLYYKSVVPSPAYPDNWAIWIALIWAGAGLAVLLWLKLRHGALLAQTAEIIGSGDAPVERGLTSDIMESTRAGRSTPASGGPQ